MGRLIINNGEQNFIINKEMDFATFAKQRFLGGVDNGKKFLDKFAKDNYSKSLKFSVAEQKESVIFTKKADVEKNLKSVEFCKDKAQSDDIFIGFDESKNDFFVKNKGKKQSLTQYVVYNSPFQLELIGDKCYQRIAEQHLSETNIKIADFEKSVKNGRIMYLLNENAEQSEELKKDKDLSINTLPSVDDIIKYINSADVIFPFPAQTLSDTNLMSALKNRLVKQDVDTLKAMLNQLKKKNEELRKQIASISQDNEVRMNMFVQNEIQAEMNANAELSQIKEKAENALNFDKVEIKIEPTLPQADSGFVAQNKPKAPTYDPNDGSALDFIKSEQAKNTQNVAQEKQEQSQTNLTKFKPKIKRN